MGVIWSAETGGDASGERSVHVLLHDGDDEDNIGPFSHDGVIQGERLSNTFSHHILEPSNSACIERPAKGFSCDTFLKSFIGVLRPPSHISIYGSVVGPLPIARAARSVPPAAIAASPTLRFLSNFFNSAC